MWRYPAAGDPYELWGGLGGYLATRQEEQYVMNYPHHLYSIFKNSKGEFGYARALPERTSYYVREKAVEYLRCLLWDSPCWSALPRKTDFSDIDTLAEALKKILSKEE